MFKRFIATSFSKFEGHWGSGDTVEEAKKNLRSARGNPKKCKMYQFTSDLPFAPSSKLKVDENEADCWMGSDGSMSWIRCEREEITS